MNTDPSRLRGSNAAIANAQGTRLALVVQPTPPLPYPLPFTLDDCVTLLVLAECLAAAGHFNRAARIRRLYSRMGAALLDVRAAVETDGPVAGLTICDAADVFWSLGCRGMADDEVARARLLAYRLLRAVDWAMPEPARFMVTASGRAELLLANDAADEPARPFSVERAGRPRDRHDGGLLAGLLARVARIVEC